MLVPYVYMDGEWTIADDTIKKMWDKIVEDELNTIVFYDADIRSKEEFLEFMQRPANNPVVTLVDNQIAGMAWFNGYDGKMAFGHFLFFKAIWGCTDEIGNKVIEYWFSLKKDSGDLLFKTILGVIPEFNQKAIRFVKRIGFKELGTIPDFNYFPYLGEDKGITLLYRKP